MSLLINLCFMVLSDAFTFKGQFAVTKSTSNGERFIDPKSSNATALTSSSSSTNTTLLGDLYVDRGDMTKWDTRLLFILRKHSACII